MILPLFFLLISLAFGLIIIGKYTDAPVYSILGFILIFMLGIFLVNNDITYKTGEIVSYDYVEFGANNSIVLNQSEMNNIYSIWSGDTLLGLDYKYLIGLYLAIASIMGFISIITKQKTTNIERD
jgi:hypothetical protein